MSAEALVNFQSETANIVREMREILKNKEVEADEFWKSRETSLANAEILAERMSAVNDSVAALDQRLKHLVLAKEITIYLERKIKSNSFEGILQKTISVHISTSVGMSDYFKAIGDLFHGFDLQFRNSGSQSISVEFRNAALISEVRGFYPLTGLKNIWIVQ